MDLDCARARQRGRAASVFVAQEEAKPVFNDSAMS